ncbi:MAG: hypothetical protein KAI24_06330, partial [Planctomycetes bacterium]|nr:hypothetical protein [Planctomycetota bacterium]
AMMMLMPGMAAIGPVFLAPFLMIIVMIFCVTILNPNGRLRMLGRLQNMQRAIGWFRAQPVTCHPMPDDDELDRLLAPHDYQRITIDGRDVRSWRDLAERLQQHTAPIKFPEDPRARVLALLAQMCDESPRRVVVWRDAAHAAALDPGMVAAFVGDWSAHAPTMRPGLLVFLDLPSRAAAEAADERTRIARGDAGEAPARAVLDDAPDGAWWKPEPGELTDRSR